jgi:hypothetical protein
VDVDEGSVVMAALIMGIVVVHMTSMHNAGVLVRLRMRVQRANWRQQQAEAQEYAQQTRKAAHGEAVYAGLALKRQHWMCI